MTRVIITCGAGGVGKTTISAALALRLAEEGRKVMVITIDPARRLADALGLADLGNTPQRVPTAAGELQAMMLDAKRSFDDLIAKHAPTPEARDRILANHYYRSVSERLPGIHEYMAIERLLSVVRAQEVDVVVLDTPPTRHALDFLSAPERMAGLMDEGVMRWLVLPASTSGWRMLEMGSDVLAGILKRLLGQTTIEDIADFFTGFQSLWSGFRERSLAAQALLRGTSTQFVLVTAPAPGARADALAFLDVLRTDGMPFAGFLVNRCASPVVEPSAWPAPATADDPSRWDATVLAITSTLKRHRSLVAAQEAAIADLLTHAPRGAVAWRIPEAEGEVHNVEGLRALGEALAASGALSVLGGPR